MSTNVRVGQPPAAPHQTVSLAIDGKSIVVERGTTVLRAALANGIYIPHLCDYRDLTPFAGCRCCLVEIEGARGIETSCTVQCRDGMVVQTDTIQLREHTPALTMPVELERRRKRAAGLALGAQAAAGRQRLARDLRQLGFGIE